MIYTYPNQRESITTKLKPEWYEPNMRYWVTLAKSLNDKADTVRNLNAANGIVDAETYGYLLKPLSNLPDTTAIKLPGEIRDIDFITPIKEKNIGEYVELPYSYQVNVNDPDITFKRRADVRALIEPIINEVMQQAVTEVSKQEQPQPINPAEIQTKIDKAIKSWIDERVIHADNTIKWANTVNKFEEKRLQAFYDWWATEEVYIYLYIDNGEFYYDIISPTEGYPILSGKDYVEDGDAFIIHRRMSINQIYTYYEPKMSAADKKYVDAIIKKDYNAKSPDYFVNNNIYKDIYGRKIINTNTGRPYNNSDSLLFSSNDIIDEHILFYVTQVEKNILTRLNELGQMTESIVPNDYTTDPMNGDISIRKEWINEVWKQVMLGNIESGLFIKPEPAPLQIYNSRGDVKLPVVGKKGLLKGVNINPVPKRILPSLALYRIINLHIERSLAKYKGATELIPLGMLNSTGDPKGTMFYKLADNTIIYDETKFSVRDAKEGYNVIGNNSLSSYIRDLIEIRETIKSEAWDLANMNDARFGQAAASATVRNNEQNLYRAKLGSVLMITQFHNVLSRLHEMSVEYGKVVYESGLSGTLFNQERQPVYFNIPGGALSDTQIGVSVVNSILEKQKLQDFKDLAFSAAQNQEFDLAAEAISGDNIPAIKKAIHEFAERTRAFQLEMERAKGESAMVMANANKEVETIKHTNKLAEIELEQDKITEREVKLAEINKTNNKEV